MRAGKRNRRVRFERNETVHDPRFGGGAPAWVEVCTVWAEVQDVLPSKAESAPDGVEVALRPARVRMSYRTGLTSDMRIVVLGTIPRVLDIVAGPAELGHREGLEFVAQEVSRHG